MKHSRPPKYGLKRLAFWQEKIALYEKQGGPLKEFCLQNGFSYHQFYHWRKRLTKEAQCASFIPLEVQPESFKQALTKTLGIPEPEWVARFIKSLFQQDQQ